jgi:hypothetical protein
VAAGSGSADRRVRVEPERLDRWLAGVPERHGPVVWRAVGDEVVGTAADGTVLRCTVPFPPLPPAPERAADPVAALVAHALVPRRVGVLLVRRGGHAAGVFDGATLVASKVGSRLVAGRTAAGGQSQQRFARRREGQARLARGAAADVAARVLVPAAASLDAVVLGGDRRSVEAVLDDPRLAPLRSRVTGPLLDVPDPRLRVLQATPPLFRAVHVRLTDPPTALRFPP